MTGYAPIDAGTDGCLERFEAGAGRLAIPPKIGLDRVTQENMEVKRRFARNRSPDHQGLTTTTMTIAIKSAVGTSFMAR